MAQHVNVPEFGKWEKDDTAYTQSFENARKGRAGKKLINPNDPQENPDAFPKDVPSAQRRGDQDAPKPKEKPRASREDGDRQHTDSPLGHDAMAQKPASDSPHHHYGDRAADPQRRAGRISGGSDRSTEQSPLHPHYHGKAGSKGGVSSHSRERKPSSEGGHGLAPPAPGRSRMRRSSQGDETPERGSTLPKFGEWDESNPSSADGYTHIFNTLREEKQTASAKGPIIANDSEYINRYNQNSSSRSTGCWCFGWGKK